MQDWIVVHRTCVKRCKITVFQVLDLLKDHGRGVSVGNFRKLPDSAGRHDSQQNVTDDEDDR